jgi:hypothetical protein
MLIRLGYWLAMSNTATPHRNSKQIVLSQASKRLLIHEEVQKRQYFIFYAGFGPLFKWTSPVTWVMMRHIKFSEGADWGEEEMTMAGYLSS